ncbi:hypothetical protein EKO04_010517 [Ascochyta lentis]|uniref:Mg2+ transporter protein n=1 Tax=Ascochyta lentis TaxID=205686 RepID=A0A8H7ME78_9PLEO|nr:hypothetical protein EKO04_010517 [Ascochyta lentis]
MQPLRVLHFSAGVWTLESRSLEEPRSLDQWLNDTTAPNFQYILIEEDVFSINKQPAPELVKQFRIPGHLLADVYRRSNGFFSSAESADEDGHLQSHYAWYRILIKMATRDAKSSYTWHEMTFCSLWTPNRNIVLCIGVPSLFGKLLQNALSRMETALPAAEPYSLHVPLLEAIISMQDTSVWSLRDIVRGIEKDRSLPVRGFQGFLMMYEAARHAIHTFEVLTISVQTVEAMQQDLVHLSSGNQQIDKSRLRSLKKSRTQIKFQVQMLQNLLLRSQSNKERLKNEIALAYNMIAQRDSSVMTGLGEAAKRDSRAMRTIAVVTMAFLPPTFLSAIFSMSFFNYTPEPSGVGWSVSDKFWVYWVCAVPLTCLTLAVWFWRQRQSGVKT